jgi:hypothetical protein
MTNRSFQPRDDVAGLARRRLHVYSALMWSLTLLFALRVVGQAIQFWVPQRFLPPVDDFQGSSLPYWVLLLSQLVILALMIHYTRRVQGRSLVPERRAGTILARLGGVYMAVSLGRIAIALLVSDSAPWFTAWIPAVFHVVLAWFVLTLASYHVVESRPQHGEED